MCDFNDYVASYDEAIDVVRQYEDATNTKFLVIKRRAYAPGTVKSINVARVDAKVRPKFGAACLYLESGARPWDGAGEGGKVRGVYPTLTPWSNSVHLLPLLPPPSFPSYSLPCLLLEVGPLNKSS